MNLIDYVTYNHWANNKLAQLLCTLNVSMLDKEIISSFPTIRKTVHHIWDAELVWMSRLKYETVNWPPSNAFNNPNIDEFVNTSYNLLSYLSNQEQNYFDEKIIYKNLKAQEFSNTRTEMIWHCMNHSTFHRGQIVTMLRQIGIKEIPQTDLIAYLRK